jgi:hypothetical protein
MKTKSLLVLFSLLLTVGHAAIEQESTESHATAVQPRDELTPANILAAQVREIAAAKDLSAQTKKQQIAKAIRLALLAATANLTNSNQSLQLVLELATQAAKAAPEFADAVLSAINDSVGQIPLLAGFGGLAAKVQDAVTAGVKAAAAESGEVHFESEHHEKERPEPEFGGKDDDHVVSPSR